MIPVTLINFFKTRTLKKYHPKWYFFQLSNANFKYRFSLANQMVRGDVSHVYEKPLFQYIIIFSIISTFIISILALINTYQLKSVVIPKAINVNDFLQKLTAHAEVKNYAGVSPSNVIQVNNNNFANLQTQISGLDISYIGSFIVQYSDRIVIYDYDNDKVRGSVALQQQKPGAQQQQAQLPKDLFTKLNKHVELQGLQNEKPAGGQIDSASLDTLKQQFAEVYANAKVGDYILRYQTKLIIYDYTADKIVNTVKLG